MAESGTLTIRIDGIEELQDKLAKLGRLLTDMRKTFKSVGEYLINFYEDDVFLSQGGVYGTPWADLSPDTIAAKDRHRNDLGSGISARAILQYSGQMRHSWKLQSAPMYALIRNTSDHYAFHQEGTSRMPQREIAKIDHQRKSAIERIVTDDISERIQSL